MPLCPVCPLPSLTYTCLCLVSCLYLVSKGWSGEHDGDFPTLEEMKNIWKIGPEPGEGATQDEVQAFTRKKELAVWYWTKYLPATAGKATYGKVCFYYMPVDKVRVHHQDVYRVTTADEAFGILLYENCMNKWINQAKSMTRENGFKREQYKKSDPSTHKYKAKWTDSCSGRGTGWSKDAAEPFRDYRKASKKFRSEDAGNGWAVHKLVLGWVQQANNVVVGVPPRTANGRSNRNKMRQPSMQEELDQDLQMVPHSEDPKDPSVFIDFDADEDYGTAATTRSSSKQGGDPGAHTGLL